MDKKHTELPWSWHEHGVGEFVVYSEHNQEAICVFDDPVEIYGFPDGYATSGQAEANARLIVTAVNYHDRLRDVLSAIMYHDERGQGIGYAEAMKKARTLLADLDDLEKDQ